MLKRKPELILIDLDGTLVDTVPDLAKAADAMMVDLGLAPRGETAVRAWIGNGVPKLVKRALTNSLDGEPDPDLFARAEAVFLKHYAADVCTLSRPYSGVMEGLEWMAEAGYTVGCITNKPEQFTTPILDTLDMTRRFSVIVCGDTLPVKKPDPGQLFYAAEQLGMLPDHCLMVGDSQNDVQAARAAGFMVACVPYGYNHGEDIHLSRPDAVIETLLDVRGILPED